MPGDSQRRQPSVAPSEASQRRPRPPSYPPPASAFQFALPEEALSTDVEEDSPSHQPSESSELQGDYSYYSPAKEVHDVDFDVEEQEVKQLHQQMYVAEAGQTLDSSLL